MYVHVYVCMYLAVCGREREIQGERKTKRERERGRQAEGERESERQGCGVKTQKFLTALLRDLLHVTVPYYYLSSLLFRSLLALC